MTTQHIKRIIGLLLLGGLITYFGIKLFRTVDETLLALLILAAVCFVVVLVIYVLNK